MNVTMKAMLEKLVKDFNDYSELVALNYAKKKEGKCDEGTLQWNRGNMNRIEEYMKGLADRERVVSLNMNAVFIRLGSMIGNATLNTERCGS